MSVNYNVLPQGPVRTSQFGSPELNPSNDVMFLLGEGDQFYYVSAT